MRLKSYPKMKDSGVEWIGKIPEHWKIAKIKFFCETNPSKNEVNNLPKDLEISFLPMEKIGVDGKLKLEEKRKLNEVVNEFTYFRNGDIIVAKITPCFENGKGSLCEGLENEIGFGTTELHVLRPKKELDSIFTYWWTRSNQFFQNGEASMYGAAGQKRISIEFIKNFKISYPESILEQREIGEFLKKHIEKTDEEIRKNKKSILLLKEKQQSLINQSVTKGLDPSASMKDSGVGWIGEIPEKWIVKKLKFSVENRREKQKKESKNLSYVGLENVESKTGRLIDVNKEMTDSDAKLFVKNDVLFGKLRPYLAKVLLTEFDGSCSGEFLVLRGITYVPKFLKYLLLSEGCNKIIVSSTYGAKMPRAEWSFIGNMLFPSTEENEQKRISDFLEKEISKIYNLSSKTKLEIKKLQEFRRSLISLTVTGKIDVTSLA